MTEFYQNKALQKALSAHWQELYRLTVFCALEDLPLQKKQKRINDHVQLLERNFSNNVMALFDNNLAYSTK